MRYLEKAFLNLDYEQYKLVREALYERSTFINIAPYLAHQLPIVLPIKQWYLIPYYWVGAKFYDLFAGSHGLSKSYYLSKERTIEVFPMINPDTLAGSVVYYDGIQNDSRMNMALVLTALYEGASVANKCEVVELYKENNKIKGAVIKDGLTGETFTVKAKGVINATGPYTDAVRKLDDPSLQTIVQPSSGVHVVLPDYFSPRGFGFIEPNTSDGRVIFSLPWQVN
jgi:glycerol-3-phosphate dehydrogenase